MERDRELGKRQTDKKIQGDRKDNSESWTRQKGWETERREAKKRPEEDTQTWRKTERREVKESGTRKDRQTEGEKERETGGRYSRTTGRETERWNGKQRDGRQEGRQIWKESRETGRR
jgi:hypothetical protein